MILPYNTSDLPNPCLFRLKSPLPEQVPLIMPLSPRSMVYRNFPYYDE
jgi:hypothetical protein